MSNERSSKSISGVVTLHDDEGTLAAPTTAPTTTFDTHPSGSYARRVSIGIDRGGSASGDVALSADAYYVGYDATAEKWRRIGDVNEGGALTINDVGFAELLDDVLGAFSWIMIVGTTDKELTITLTPIEVAA